MKKTYKKILSMPFQKDDGIMIELTKEADMLQEIRGLRSSIKNILDNLNKFKGMKAYDSIGQFETKYIEDSVLICENQLNVKYVYSDQPL